MNPFNQAPRDPLWVVMRKAKTEYLEKGLGVSDRRNDVLLSAALTRAIRDWLVPDLRPLNPWFGTKEAKEMGELENKINQQLYSLLTSEIESMENGGRGSG